MRFIRKFIIIVSVLIIIGAFYVADFHDLVSRNNLISLFLIFVSTLNILSMVILAKQDQKKKHD
jgi:hypothetical protein